MMEIVRWFLTILGLAGTVSYAIAFLFSPVALWKGFKNKEWGFGKNLLIALVSGLVAQIVSISLLALIN
jgi:hypothetical protein